MGIGVGTRHGGDSSGRGCAEARHAAGGYSCRPRNIPHDASRDVVRGPFCSRLRTAMGRRPGRGVALLLLPGDAQAESRRRTTSRRSREESVMQPHRRVARPASCACVAGAICLLVAGAVVAGGRARAGEHRRHDRRDDGAHEHRTAIRSIRQWRNRRLIHRRRGGGGCANPLSRAPGHGCGSTATGCTATWPIGTPRAINPSSLS